MRDEERAVAAEHQPAAEVRPRVERRRLMEDDLDVFDARRGVLDQPASSDRRVVGAAVAWLCVAPVDQPIRCEAWIERDVEQSTLSPGVHRWQARTGSDSLPSAPTTRRRPGRSVTSIRPSGRKAMPHGFSRPSATVTTSNATFALRSGARVCPAKAGVWPVAVRRASLDGFLRSGVGLSCSVLLLSAAAADQGEQRDNHRGFHGSDLH